MSQRWFYYNSNPGTGRSPSWSSASNLHNYLINNKNNGLKGSRYWIDLNGQTLKVGDLIFLYWKTTSGNKKAPYHTLVVSKPNSNSNKVGVTAHTGDCLDRPLSYWLNSSVRKLAVYVIKND